MGNHIRIMVYHGKTWESMGKWLIYQDFLGTNGCKHLFLLINSTYSHQQHNQTQYIVFKPLRLV